MKVLIVYCHPSENSFTHQVYRSFLDGLRAAGHEVITSDLYKLDFKTDLSEEEYDRETYYRADIPVSEDVLREQEKIRDSDALAFIYPVFWTEAPAKLVGWFDRVWTAGFAYNPHPKMKVLKKVLVIACTGKTAKALEETGERRAMETVMLGDRIRDRAEEKKMVILDNVTHWDEEARGRTIPVHLQTAYKLGEDF